MLPLYFNTALSCTALVNIADVARREVCCVQDHMLTVPHMTQPAVGLSTATVGKLPTVLCHSLAAGPP